MPRFLSSESKLDGHTSTSVRACFRLGRAGSTDLTARTGPSAHLVWRHGSVRSVTLRLVMDLLQRRWRVLLLAIVISAGAGWYVGMIRPATYESTARALVGPIAGDLDAVRAAGSNVETYAQLLSTQPVINATIVDVGPPSTTDEFLQRVHVQTDTVSRIISITVTDTNPHRAADTANVLFEHLAGLLPSGAEAVGQLTIVDTARPAQRSASPDPVTLAALSGISGLGAAALSLFFLEYLDPRIRSRHDLESLVKAPYLVPVWIQRPLRAAGDDARLPVRVHESANQLASRLLAIGPDRPHSLLIPSVEPGDEAPELAVSLAVAAAATGLRVALLDGDDVSRRLTADYGDLIGSVANPSVGTEAGPSLTLSEPIVLAGAGESAMIARQLRELKRAGVDLTVVQVGPLDQSHLAGMWARAVDATVVAARSGSTRRELIESLVDKLDALEVVVTGSTLMHVSSGHRRRSKAASVRSTSLVRRNGLPDTRADTEPSTLGSLPEQQRDS